MNELGIAFRVVKSGVSEGTINTGAGEAWALAPRR
jgi:hypothetical protein